MAKLANIAAVHLRLPDGRIILNRRGKTAPTSPGLLAFYGGHIDQGETPIKAAKRELQEETSIDASELEFKFLGDYKITEPVNKHFYLFEVPIESSDFEVYEGDGSEVISRDGALARNDITPSARYALENLIKK